MPSLTGSRIATGAASFIESRWLLSAFAPPGRAGRVHRSRALVLSRFFTVDTVHRRVSIFSAVVPRAQLDHSAVKDSSELALSAARIEISHAEAAREFVFARFHASSLSPNHLSRMIRQSYRVRRSSLRSRARSIWRHGARSTAKGYFARNDPGRDSYLR